MFIAFLSEMHAELVETNIQQEQVQNLCQLYFLFWVSKNVLPIGIALFVKFSQTQITEATLKAIKF